METARSFNPRRRKNGSMQNFVGETALWRPKSGFPHALFRESHKAWLEKVFSRLSYFGKVLSYCLETRFSTKLCIEPKKQVSRRQDPVGNSLGK